MLSRAIIPFLGLMLCLPAVAGEQKASEDSVEVCRQFLSEKVVLWQQHLKLTEWQVSVTIAPKSDLKPGTLGGIRWDKRKKTATLAVMHPSDYRLPMPEILKDLEFTVVHELVHLELASLPKSEASRKSEEHAVNRITEALLGAERNRTPAEQRE